MKTILLFLLFFTTAYSQNFEKPAEVTMKVAISNFNASPPDCGILQDCQCYKATIKDYHKILYGEDVLFFVICKTERYPPYETILNDDLYITVSDDNAEIKNSALFNFTDYKDDEIKKRTIYKLVSIKNSPF